MSKRRKERKRDGIYTYLIMVQFQWILCKGQAQVQVQVQVQDQAQARSVKGFRVLRRLGICKGRKTDINSDSFTFTATKQNHRDLLPRYIL